MKKVFILFIYCLIIVSGAMYAFKHPAYNWDALPYMNVVLLYDKTDEAAAHQSIYNIAKDEMPVVFYNRLVDPGNAYRRKMAQSPELFTSQLPFYVVKPLYTRMVWLFFKAGISLLIATIWPSVIAYFFTGLLLFFWIQKYWTGWQACIASSLMMLSPPVLAVASLSTPDALSGLLLFAAVYWLVEKKMMVSAFVFMVLAVFARLDTIIPAICLLAVGIFKNKQNGRLTVARNVSLYCILAAVFFIVSAGARSYGWSIFFYPTFAKQLNVSYNANSSFSFIEYVALIKSQLATGLLYSLFSLFLLLVLLVLRDAPVNDFGKLTTEQMLAVLFVLIIALRFVLQPLVADRICIPYYLSVTVFLIKKNSLSLSMQ